MPTNLETESLTEEIFFFFLIIKLKFPPGQPTLISLFYTDEICVPSKNGIYRDSFT